MFRVLHDEVVAVSLGAGDLAYVHAAERAVAHRIEPQPVDHAFAGNGRAMILGETDGLVKVVAAKDGPILGFHLVGPWARVFCYVLVPGRWVVGGAINNGGNVLRWLCRVIGTDLGDPDKELTNWRRRRPREPMAC